MTCPFQTLKALQVKKPFSFSLEEKAKRFNAINFRILQDIQAKAVIFWESYNKAPRKNILSPPALYLSESDSKCHGLMREQEGIQVPPQKKLVERLKPNQNALAMLEAR